MSLIFLCASAIMQWEAHKGAACSVQFGRDETSLFTAGSDCMVRTITPLFDRVLTFERICASGHFVKRIWIAAESTRRC